MSQQLIKLAEIFHSNGSSLYLVGGYVRDALLRKESYDIDVCSNLPPADVCTLLENSGFIVPQSNMPLGTLIIVGDDFKCEYTCFRTESYRKGGGHTPERVTFPASMMDDALRRDFTINAIYYDITAGKTADPLGMGLDDLNHGIIRTTRNPADVFAEDPLRIMRLCRIAGTLVFSIDSGTLDAAVACSHLVGTLTRHRIGDEFLKLLESGGAGLGLLYDTGAAAIISPCITKQACALLEGANLALPVALAVLFEHCAAARVNSEMRSLAVPVKTAGLASFLIDNKKYHQKDADALKLDIAQMGRETANCLSSYLKVTGNSFANDFGETLSMLLKSGAPMGMNELQLTGKDIIDSLNVAPGPILGTLLKRAFRYAVLNPGKNTPKELVQYLSNGLGE